MEFYRCKFPIRIAVTCDRSEFAGDVDDTSGRRLADERKHCLGHGESTEEICLEDAIGGVEIDFARRTVTGSVDASVVDEDVEPAEVFFDFCAGGFDGLAVGDVELDEARVDSLF